MAQRVWDSYLSPQDKAHVELHPALRKGAGERPALLMVDLYRWVFGDEPQPLLEAVKTWPGSCGLAAWEALPDIEKLLASARELDIPVIHITGMDNAPGWRKERGKDEEKQDPAFADRRERRYQIVDQLAPIDGEITLRKIAPSAFFGTPLASILRELDVDTIVVAGESTSGCIRATVVDGRSYRFDVVVVEECVFDRHEAAHAINLFDMDQKYADVTPLSEAIAYLERVAQGRKQALAAGAAH